MRDSITTSILFSNSATRLVCESGVQCGGGTAMRMGVLLGTYAKELNHFVGVGAFMSRGCNGEDMFSLTSKHFSGVFDHED